MFSPEHLVSLKAVVQEGTVLAAADRLGLSPSAISQQLSRLQKEVGQPVLVRQGRGLVPTDAAAILVQVADEMQYLEETARAELDRLGSEVAGRLTWASFPTALVGLLAPASALLRERHPALTLTFHELEADLSLEPLRRGDVDVAVVHDWTDAHFTLPEGLRAGVLGTDIVDLVAPADHGLSLRDGAVDPDGLDGQSWIDDTPGVFSDWLLSALHTRGLDYRIAAQVDHYAGKLALVAARVGIGLVPRLGRPDLPEGIVALPLRDPPTRRIMVVHREASLRRPAVEAAVDAVREVWALDDELTPPVELPAAGPGGPRPGL